MSIVYDCSDARQADMFMKATKKVDPNMWAAASIMEVM